MFSEVIDRYKKCAARTHARSVQHGGRRAEGRQMFQTCCGIFFLQFYVFSFGQNVRNRGIIISNSGSSAPLSIKFCLSSVHFMQVVITFENYSCSQLLYVYIMLNFTNLDFSETNYFIYNLFRKYSILNLLKLQYM